MLEKLALQKKVITDEIYQEAMDACKGIQNFEAAIEDYFLSRQIISQKTIDQLKAAVRAIKTIKRNMKFGEVAIQMGLIDQHTLQQALIKQKEEVKDQKQPRRIGQILVETGKLKKEQIALVVEAQKQAQVLNAPDTLKKPAPKKDKAAEPETRPAFQKTQSISISGGLILEIDKDKLLGVLKKEDHFNDRLTPEDIVSLLKGEMIQYGLADRQLIDKFIRSDKSVKKGLVVARGKPPAAGKDGWVKYCFLTDYLTAGGVDETGNFDFKERGEIPRIEQGTLLAERFPSLPAKNGRNIYGETVIAPPAAEPELKTQTGADISEDGLKIYAAISGWPQLTWSGYINVVDVFSINGDVSYETGHVHYNGNVEIKGCLRHGFKINANSVVIQEIDGGLIQAEGDVTVLGALNNAVIQSRGHVSAKFIHNSKISCLGHLIVEKEIVDSTILTSGTAGLENGEIINSSVHANKGLRVKNIGSSRTDANTVIVGTDGYLEHELSNIETKIKTLEADIRKRREKIGQLSSENEQLNETITQLAGQLDKLMDNNALLKQKAAEDVPADGPQNKAVQKTLNQNTIQADRLNRELDDCFEKTSTISAAISQLETELSEKRDHLDDLAIEKDNFMEWGKANPGSSRILVSGKVFAGTMIKGPHSQKKIADHITRVKIEERSVKIKDTDTTVFEIKIDDNF